MRAIKMNITIIVVTTLIIAAIAMLALFAWLSDFNKKDNES